MKYILERLAEPSTWRGLVAFATGALGYKWSPEMATQIVAAGVAIAGLIGMMTPDKLGGRR